MPVEIATSEHDRHEQSPETHGSSPAIPTTLHQYLLKKMPLVRSTSDLCDGLFVEIAEHGTTTLYPLHSARVVDQLNLLNDEFNANAPDAFLSDRDRKNALSFMRAKAHLVAEHRPVFKRLAWNSDEQAIWIDLTRPDGRCVRVTAAGWAIAVPNQPLFVRYRTQRPLPMPERSPDGYQAFVRMLPPGMSADTQKLLLGTILGCFIPSNYSASFSYPVILLRGDPGSGKSTLTKNIKMLVDNEAATASAKPAKIDDLFVVGQTSLLIALDNLDHLKGDVSDAICQATTGSAIAKRRLYTDSDITILRVHGPFLLNGIAPLLQRQDIVDRSVSIILSRIEDYDPEAGDDAESALPFVFGYVLDLMSRALANYDATKLDNLPRLATVAKFAAAAEPFGCPTPFVTLLHKNQAEALISTDEDHPVIEAFYELMAATATWRGTYKDLLSVLEAKASSGAAQTPDWPKSAKKLSLFVAGRMRMLRALGVVVVPGAKQNNGRIVSISRTETFVYEKPLSASERRQSTKPMTFQ